MGISCRESAEVQGRKSPRSRITAGTSLDTHVRSKYYFAAAKANWRVTYCISDLKSSWPGPVSQAERGPDCVATTFGGNVVSAEATALPSSDIEIR
jgi:hypothetical protein